MILEATSEGVHKQNSQKIISYGSGFTLELQEAVSVFSTDSSGCMLMVNSSLEAWA
jgi:hypothetical protein